MPCLPPRPAPHQDESWEKRLTGRVNGVAARVAGPRLRLGPQSRFWGSGPQRDKAERVLCNQRQDVLGRGRAIVVVKRKRN